MIIRLFFVVVLIFFVSCSKEDQLSEKDLWYSLNIENYEMIQQISCFCFPYEFNLPKSIKVENDEIVLIDGKDPKETVGYESFYSINSLFYFIESKLKENPEIYEINYNKEYGYPESIYFDMSKMIADEEIGYYISGLKIIDND
ncbi:MAG: DUF6174 domain-containing protein [Candidatus Marisimplicoccus sp.]|jgi:hypothetical protein|tara:strand:- start:1030 stop:1461 length:432 start_codon:yes stop_codon:yes gene_type:complete